MAGFYWLPRSRNIPNKRTITIPYGGKGRCLQLLLHVLLLPLLEDLDGELSSTDTRDSHGTEDGAHTAGFYYESVTSIVLGRGGMKGELTSVSFGQLHTTDDHAGHNLAGTLDDLVLSHLHVEATHTSKHIIGTDRYETLDGEGSPWTVVTGSGDNQGSVDGIGVHAGLVLFVDQHFAHRALMGYRVG